MIMEQTLGKLLAVRLEGATESQIQSQVPNVWLRTTQVLQHVSTTLYDSCIHKTEIDLSHSRHDLAIEALRELFGSNRDRAWPRSSQPTVKHDYGR